MKIAIVGAGALGCVYGVRLARESSVAFVVRDLGRAPKKITLVKVNASKPGDGDDCLDEPHVFTEIPADCDVVLVAVLVDQLSAALVDLLAHGGPSNRIVVFLTPLLPATITRMRASLGDRLVVGMPGVVSYSPEARSDGTALFRYWTPMATSTALQGRASKDERASPIQALSAALVRAGLPSEVRSDVETLNPSTTIAFFPLILGLVAGGGSSLAVIEDGALLKLALEAAKETRALAKTVGDLAPFASLLLSFAGTFTIRAGVKLARSRFPESILFFEKHFGGKLVAQNAVMLGEIRVLARERGVRLDALDRLAAKAGIGAT